MTEIARITAATDWWKEFFHGIALDLWRAAVPEEATAFGIESPHLVVVAKKG